MDTGTTDAIYRAFAGHGPAVQAALLHGANDLFFGLAVIEVVWALGWSLAHKNDIFDIMIVLFKLAIAIGFWFWIMQNWVQMAKAITDTFGLWGNAAAVAAGGSANMMPMGFLTAGIDLAGAIWGTVKLLGVTQIPLGILLVFCGIGVLVIFVIFAATILLVVIEAFLASYTGTVLLAFGANSFTRDFAVSPVRYAISVGAKRLTLQIIAGIAQGMVQGWAVQIKNGPPPDWTSIGVMIAMPSFFLVLALIGPKMAQDAIMGSHMSTQDGIIKSSRQLASAAVQLGAAVSGVGAAGVAAYQLAGRQMLASQAAGQAQGGVAARAATMARLTAANATMALASDVGQRLTGSYSAQHGHMGWRVASQLNKENP